MNIFVALFWLILALVCLVDAWHWVRTGRLTLYRFFLLDGTLRLKGFVATMTAANLSIGNFLVFIASWGYLFGPVGIFWFLINLVMNVIGFRLFLPTFKSYIEDPNNSGTIHDYLSAAFSRHRSTRLQSLIRLSASLVTVTGLLFAIVFELSLAVDLLAPASPTERIFLFSALTFLICLFTAYGGFKTLITSDISQSLVLAVSTVFLVILMAVRISGNTTGLAHYMHSGGSLGAIGWPSILSIMVIGTGWMLVAMDQWQRTCASRSYPTSRKGVYIYLGIVALFALAYGLWGIYDHQLLLPSLSADQLKRHSSGGNPLADIFLLPSVSLWARSVLTIILCGLIAAALSTTNTFLTVCSHSITSDVLVVSLAKRSIHDLKDDEQQLFVGLARAIVVVMGALVVITYGLLVSRGLLTDALSFFFIAYSVQFALLAPMVMSGMPEKWRPAPMAALVSILTGFVCALFAGFFFWHAVQRNQSPILGITPSDCLTLTPVLTFMVGLLPLLISLAHRRIEKHAPSIAVVRS